jgi:hypothetical protein
MGRGGKLDLNVDKVHLAEGSKTLLSAVKNTKGGSHIGAMTGAIVATRLIVWPAAPFFLFMHGKDIAIPKGTPLTAFVQGDDVLDGSKFVKQSAQHSTTAPLAQLQRSAQTAPDSPTQIQPVSEPSLGEVARKNRADKAEQQQSQQQQNQSQQAQEQSPN